MDQEIVRPLFLLGAGASVEAGLPTAQEITGRLLHEAEIGGGLYNTPLNFVIGQIIGYDSRTGVSPNQLPGIERVVSAVELLKDRDSLEIAPFVESWDRTITAQDVPVRGKLNDEADALARSFGIQTSRLGAPASYSAHGARSALEKAIDARVGRPNSATFFHLHNHLTQYLVNILALDDDRDLGYLRPLFRPAGGVLPATATLNYDLAIETAAVRLGVDCDTGVSEWTRIGELSWRAGAMQLLKLHGSIDWSRDYHQPRGEPQQTLPQERLTVTINPVTPFVVFGQREKLRPEGPFLQLLELFRNHLNASKYLIVVGYGFADHHINELVVRWINADDERRIVVVDPHFPKFYNYSKDFRAGLVRALSFGQDRGNHMAVNRLLIMRTGTGDALKRLLEPNDPYEFLVREFAKLANGAPTDFEPR